MRLNHKEILDRAPAATEDGIPGTAKKNLSNSGLPTRWCHGVD